jgi:iron-sulfur cluster assembly protein
MLTLTETATTVVKGIVERDPAVADGGLRIGTMPGTEKELQVAVVAEPQPGDSLIENNGARVFISDAASAVLENKTLDAQVGDNGTVTFALVPQA